MKFLCHVATDWVSEVSMEPAASISRAEVSSGQTFLDFNPYRTNVENRVSS